MYQKPDKIECHCYAAREVFADAEADDFFSELVDAQCMFGDADRTLYSVQRLRGYANDLRDSKLKKKVLKILSHFASDDYLDLEH